MISAANLRFASIAPFAETNQGRDLILKFHYSKSFHPVFVFMGMFFYFDVCVAACCFRAPAAKWKRPVLELARLVRHDETEVPLTRLIALCVDEIKKKKEYDLLISYADKTYKHHGGVYQAASWHYSGASLRQNDGLIIDGKFLAGRACNHKYGTRSADKLRSLHPELHVVPHFSEGKHLYWRALSRTGTTKALDLGLKMMPYPKPDLCGVSK